MPRGSVIVYVCFHEYDYEGATQPQVAFSTEDAARDWCAKYKAMGYGDDTRYEPIIVDEPDPAKSTPATHEPGDSRGGERR